ncbi:ribonuclease P protein component [Peribacillus deserti]|uniref:Ribonuclease P protein component n=1 Tax=Peribacillus deserti TaxID=673318 RepID=A0ABS2QK77_9BACI|nr:ribonuclease P protein component [Peribacillus deserti]MBM7693575.1 ribonuclease P protein component [Peribacillus deserti]
MKKKLRIKKNEEFQTVFQKGESVANRQFVIYILEKSDQDYFRIGLSISKKIGNAVVRNQIKRYIRQAFLELIQDITPGRDYVIIARKPAADLDFFEVKSSLIHALRRGRSINPKVKNERLNK